MKAATHKIGTISVSSKVMAELDDLVAQAKASMSPWDADSLSVVKHFYVKEGITTGAVLATLLNKAFPDRKFTPGGVSGKLSSLRSSGELPRLQ